MGKKLRQVLQILLWVIGVAAVSAAAWYFGMYRPYLQAENSMPTDGRLVLTAYGDRTMRLEWPEGQQSDFYIVEVRDASRNEEEKKSEPLFSQQVEDAQSCILTELPSNTACTIRIYSVKRYSALTKRMFRVGEQALEVSDVFSVPMVKQADWTFDPNHHTLDFSLQLEQEETCQMFLEIGQQRFAKSLSGKHTLQYTFGEQGEYPVPSGEEKYSFSWRVFREMPNVSFYGPEIQALSLTQEDFSKTALQLHSADQGGNAFQLTWNEIGADSYVLEMKEAAGQEWQTLCSIAQGEELAFLTEHLPRYSQYAFRVWAISGREVADGVQAKESRISNETEVTTWASSIFVTIWPIQELEIYDDTEHLQPIGTAPAGAAYCVLEEKGDYFRIRHQDGYGYIDKRYCMINLPEYMEDLCAYRITNSVSAIYAVHEFAIPKVTQTVVTGYENVALSDGSYLVPLLYPVAKRLEQAAVAAAEEGYRLKIYDSFRPGRATHSLYNTAVEILDMPIPEQPYTGKMPEDMPTLEVPEPSEAEDPEAEQEPPQLTYRRLMTDGRYEPNRFLAQGRSRHNYGTALDLTIESAESGEELRMQSSMHDLSFYSEVSRNNANAKTLAAIMKGAGFGGLTSEWWHFQDNEIMEELDLTPLSAGVSIEGWKMDNAGWRYRKADGTYYQDCSQEIEGTLYRFDGQGYLQEE